MVIRFISNKNIYGLYMIISLITTIGLRTLAEMEEILFGILKLHQWSWLKGSILFCSLTEAEPETKISEQLVQQVNEGSEKEKGRK